MLHKKGYCPTCDSERELSVKIVNQTFPVRGEPVTVEAEVAFCSVCGNEVFDRELDFAALERAYAKYRRLKGLPSPGEIVTLREKYGLSQRALAKIFGWDPVTVYRYEKGAIPAPTHEELLKKLSDPKEMARLLERCCDSLSPREFARAKEKLGALAGHEKKSPALAALEERAGTFPPGPDTGFRRFDFEKLLNMVLFFIGRKEIFKTVLMKLLWYADFLHFKRYAVPISGARYVALPYGPALEDWMLCLQAAVETGKVLVEPVAVADWEADVVKAEADADESVFTPEERATLKEVADRLLGLSARALSEMSHKEDAWKLTPRNKIISYEHAFSLNWPS